MNPDMSECMFTDSQTGCSVMFGSAKPNKQPNKTQVINGVQHNARAAEERRTVQRGGA